jgi:hypothetical protein
MCLRIMPYAALRINSGAAMAVEVVRARRAFPEFDRHVEFAGLAPTYT